ncbi:hypothetical protein HQ520_09280 [bacterium]|nr:hypothetical protein [bacterium]
MKRLFALILLAGLLSISSGCTYFQNRADDAMDMIDLGFTFSKKPGFAFYYDFVPVIPIGVGYVRGSYVGLGGGKLSWLSPHHEESYGALLWGQEKVTFRHSEEDLAAMTPEEREKALLFQRTGLIGVFQGPFPGPEYLISCPHYIHLGWIGVVGSPRYLQMLDFLIGWTTLDITRDDDADEQEVSAKGWRAYN